MVAVVVTAVVAVTVVVLVLMLLTYDSVSFCLAFRLVRKDYLVMLLCGSA